MSLEPAYQYSAEPYMPDVGGGVATLNFTGAAGTRFRRYLIPLPGTLDRFKVNKYNLNLTVVATDVKFQIPASGVVRMGLYRRIGPQTLTAAVANFELVANSTYASAPILNGAPVTINDPAMTALVDLLGGQFFVCLQFEDNSGSGTSFVSFTVDGATASDTNVEYAWFTTTGAGGALPATINGSICTKTADMPFVGVAWV